MNRDKVTKRAAVLGSPITHSRSPAVHRAAYAALGLDWTYEAIDVDIDGLPAFIDGLDDSWAGLSLTMPLKERILTLVDSVTPLASSVRAANTVLVTSDGLVADNTDVEGIRRALSDAGASGDAATVIGAGATARSTVAALHDLAIAHVTVIARRPEAAAELVGFAASLGMEAHAGPWNGLAGALDTPIVVSTVPGTAADSLAPRVPASPGTLLDVAYEPSPPPLTAAWLAAGGRVATGLDMLLWQAAEQVRLMTGHEPPVEAMREALLG